MSQLGANIASAIGFARRLLRKSVGRMKRVMGPKIEAVPPAHDVEYSYDRFSILLPHGHALPIYQLEHKRYDRFLPHFASFLAPDSTVIDVGANCGDTLAGMVDRNADLKFVCVEPDDGFFGYLTVNIQRILTVHPKLEVQAIKALVGREVTNVSLEGIHGTKHAVVGGAPGGIQSSPLDRILADSRIECVSLLKVDVDGFDYDAIESAKAMLEEHHPVIFFECAFHLEFQREGYERMIGWLGGLGYTRWAVFDNFGEIMLARTDRDGVCQLIEYVWRQESGSTTRTMYYLDVLACTPADERLVEEALARY